MEVMDAEFEDMPHEPEAETHLPVPTGVMREEHLTIGDVFRNKVVKLLREGGKMQNYSASDDYYQREAAEFKISEHTSVQITITEKRR